MSKVSLHLGVTFAADPADRGSPWFRADVHFDEIDVDGDVDAQVDRMVSALGEKIAAKGEEALAQEASNISGLAVEGFGIAGMFEEYKSRTKTWQDNVVGEVRRQKRILKKIAPDEDGAEEETEKPAKKTKKGK